MSGNRHPDARLPEDAAYWEDLAVRSIDAAHRQASAEATLESPIATARGAATVESWWRGVSDSAFLLAASAVLALLGGALLSDERSSPMTSEPGTIAGALAPDDPLLRSLMDAPEAPPASVLLKLVALREEER